MFYEVFLQEVRFHHSTLVKVSTYTLGNSGELNETTLLQSDKAEHIRIYDTLD